MNNDMEYIACSAIWYKDATTSHLLPVNIERGCVVCGLMHAHCIYIFVALTGKRSVTIECGEKEEGFLTSKNRFVDRKEAGLIALAAGQIKAAPALFGDGKLDSSELFDFNRHSS